MSEQDIAHAQAELAWSRGEFRRQADWAEEAQRAATRNRDADAFTLAVRAIEETIGFALGVQDVSRGSRARRASFAARERGVEGGSVAAVLGEVEREAGEAKAVMDMNRSALNRQVFRDALALDAQALAQLSQIAAGVRPMTPQAPLRRPRPPSPLTPAATVQGPSVASLLGGLGNAAGSAFNTFNSLSGQTAKQTADQLGSWAKRQIGMEGGPGTMDARTGVYTPNEGRVL